MTVNLVGGEAARSAALRAPAAAADDRPPLDRLRLSSPRMIAVVGTLSVLIILLLFGAFAWRDRAQTFREAEVLTDDLAAVLAEHADRMFEMGDFVIGEAVRLAGPPDAPIPDDAATQRELLRLAELAPYVVSVWLGDAEGNAVLTSRRYPTPRLNAADRPRGGSVCLNRIEAVAEWMPAWLCCGRKWLQWGEVCLIGRLPAKR